MTIGQLIEALGGKLAAVSGEIQDATAFSHKSVQQLGKEMKAYGFSKYSDQQLIDGKTGELMTNCNIFMGPVYYQRYVELTLLLLTLTSNNYTQFETYGKR